MIKTQGLFLYLFVCFIGISVCKVLPNQTDDTEHYSGLLDLGVSDNSMFYWLFKSKNQSAPLLVFLPGGPGCALGVEALTDVGPWLLQEDLSLQTNPYPWTNFTHMLFLEQPIGTGFSRVHKIEDLCTGWECYAREMYLFLIKFMEVYSEFKGREFFIVGISYGRKFVLL